MARAEFDYLVRRVPRGRRLKVRIDAVNGLEVLLPAGAPLRAAAAAVAELAPWIERELAAREALRARLREPGVLPYLDERLALVPQEGRARAHRSGAALLVPAGEGAKGAIERWYRRAARLEIARRLDLASAVSAVPYTRLAIRNQRTRWASCAAAAR